MMKITLDNGRVELQSNNASECVEVLKYLYPQHMLNIRDTKGLDITKTVDPIQATTKPHIEELEVSKTNTKKRLVFFKCSCCGTVACSLLEEDATEVVCYDCHTTNKIDVLCRGYYNCECGNKGVFMQQPRVSEVRCKNCGSYHLMIYNKNTQEYTGTQITKAIIRKGV